MFPPFATTRIVVSKSPAADLGKNPAAPTRKPLRIVSASSEPETIRTLVAGLTKPTVQVTAAPSCFGILTGEEAITQIGVLMPDVAIVEARLNRAKALCS